MHVQADQPPHVLTDEIGAKLIHGSDQSWKERPDMHPQGTRGYRASIVARARAVEDTVLEEFKNGVDQYVILGAGLDTFALRNLHSGLQIFEIDQAETQE